MPINTSIRKMLLKRCSYFRGSLYITLCSWEGVQCPLKKAHMVGSEEMSLFG